jgi:hypothetical protein
MANTSIVVCDRKFDIGTRVVLWNEPGGFCAYDTTAYATQDRKTGETVVVRGKRYKSRLTIGTPNFEKLKKIVWQFALHHSGLYRSRDTFETLQQRGLSVHFICDDDGTLYQALDVRERAYHIGTNNAMSVGIEIDSRAAAGQYPDAYDPTHQKKYGVGPRRVKQDTIHGIRMMGFEYSDGQYAALTRLAQALAEIFPLINPDFPRDASGNIIKTTLQDPQSYRGFLCHYHVTKTKIDPIAFDYDRLLGGLGNPLLTVGNGMSSGDGAFPSRDITCPDLSTWLARQNALISLGYNPGPADGAYGPLTETAIRQFQADQGLAPDGIWGPRTEAAIVAALEGR